MTTAEAMLDLTAIREALSLTVGHYRTRSAFVAEWADEIYIRVAMDPEAVTLAEIALAQSVFGFKGEAWMNPNKAAAAIRRLRKAARPVVAA